MKKRMISIFLIICLLSANLLVSAEVKKDETVYATLKYDGTVEEINVVNHIYGSDDAEYYIDYGNYVKVQNMTGFEQPEQKDGQIKWPMSLLKEKSIYYQGTIEKELPIQISIKYYLDGKEVAPEKLGGASGHFRLDIGIKYDRGIDWDKAGLITQIQITPDLDVFSNIKTEGSKVVMGKKTVIAFIGFPPADQSFGFEADGRNIYFDPVSITMVPSSISLPEEIAAGVDMLSGGLDQMGGGTSALVSGAEVLTTGTEKLRSGMVELDTGIGRLYQGTKELGSSSQSLGEGINQYYNGLKQLSEQGEALTTGVGQLSSGMNALSQTGEALYGGLGQLHQGLKQSNAGNQELAAGLDQLVTGHTQLMQLAGMYANSSDPMLRKLAEGIIKEGEGLQKLNAGMKESSKGLTAIEGSAGQLYEGLGLYSEGVSTAASNIKELERGAAALPSALKQLAASFEQLKQGITQYFAGVIEVSKALGLIRENTKALPGSVGKLAEGQKQLKGGIVSLDKGIKQLSEGMGGGMGSLLGGDRESSYKSFADNEQNRSSSVQFVLRTPSIDRPKAAIQEQQSGVEKKGFFQRVLELFKRK